MSERSEFGLRAPLPEKRREPPRLYRGGSRPAKGPFGSFWVHPKGTRTRSGRKPCTCFRFFARRFATLIFEAKDQPQERRSKTGLPRCRAAYFCLGKSKHDNAHALANGEAGPKGECRRRESNRLRRTRSGTAAPPRSPPLLGPRGHIGTFTVPQPELAALRHGLLSGLAALRCSARFTAR